MADVLVTCINKQPRNNPYQGITHLGGPGGGGWRWTRQQVIASIKDKSNTFYTQDQYGNRAYIGVVDDPDGEYLRTHANGQWNDNLLSLDECIAR